MKYVSFEIAKNEFKEFSLKKTICYFVMMLSYFIEALGHQHDPTEWRFLLTLQKLA
jgi:hypothetical protein